MADKSKRPKKIRTLQHKPRRPARRLPQALVESQLPEDILAAARAVAGHRDRLPNPGGPRGRPREDSEPGTRLAVYTRRDVLDFLAEQKRKGNSASALITRLIRGSAEYKHWQETKAAPATPVTVRPSLPREAPQAPVVAPGLALPTSQPTPPVGRSSWACSGAPYHVPGCTGCPSLI